MASKASSRLFSPVWAQNNKVSRAQRIRESSIDINILKADKINRLWRKPHLGFDTAQQPQFLFLLLELSSFPVLLQHLLLLLKTFSTRVIECRHQMTWQAQGKTGAHTIVLQTSIHGLAKMSIIQLKKDRCKIPWLWFFLSSSGDNTTSHALCRGDTSCARDVGVLECYSMFFRPLNSYSAGCISHTEIWSFTLSWALHDFSEKISYWCSSAICFCRSAVYWGPAGLMPINCGWPKNCIPGVCIPIAIPLCQTKKNKGETKPDG